MPLKPFLYILTLAATLLFAAACRRGTSDNPELLHAAYILYNEPDSVQTAADMLVSLDSLSLDTRNKHIRRLLINKAQDKLFFPVSSKTNLWEEINYFSKSNDKEFHKEALYLQGRMETDKGDFLTAQQLYRESLKIEVRKSEIKNLNAKILWHLAYLSSILNHHSDAGSYAEQAYLRYREINDTLGMVYSLKLIGVSLCRLQKFDEAVIKFDSAACLAKKISLKSDQILLYAADARLKQGNISEALGIIRNISLSSDTLIRNNFFAIALNIYDKADKPDSAVMYANLLINSEDAINRHEAYRLLINPKYRNFVAADSLSYLFDRYYKSLSDYLATHEAKDFGYRTAMFNYTDHLDARKAAESKSKKLLIILLLVSSLLFLILLIVVYLLYRNKTQALLCQELKNRILVLQKINLNPGTAIDNHNDITISDSKTTPQQLIGEFRQMVKILYDSSNEFLPVSLPDKTIMDSISDYIEKRKPILKKSDLYKRIENSLNEAKPDFISNLKFITDGKVSSEETLLAILLKIGIRSTDIAVLLGVEKNTVSYRKKILLKKFNIDGVSTASLDRLILII